MFGAQNEQKITEQMVGVVLSDIAMTHLVYATNVHCNFYCRLPRRPNKFTPPSVPLFFRENIAFDARLKLV